MAGSRPIATSSVPAISASASTSLVLTRMNDAERGAIAPHRDDRRREPARHRAGHRTDPKDAARTGRQRAQLERRLLDLGEQASRVAGEGVAVTRRLHPPRVAHEERHAERGLEIVKEAASPPAA